MVCVCEFSTGILSAAAAALRRRWQGGRRPLYAPPPPSLLLPLLPLVYLSAPAYLCKPYWPEIDFNPPKGTLLRVSYCVLQVENVSASPSFLVYLYPPYCPTPLRNQVQAQCRPGAKLNSFHPIHCSWARGPGIILCLHSEML